jgi:hypothetical protein
MNNRMLTLPKDLFMLNAISAQVRVSYFLEANHLESISDADKCALATTIKAGPGNAHHPSASYLKAIHIIATSTSENQESFFNHGALEF